MRLLILTFAVAGLVGCATPTNYTDKPLGQYGNDKDTEFRIDETPGGFVVNVFYSRYQFIPESSAVQTSCKSQLTSIAYETADNRKKKLQPIEDGRIRISMGRNGFGGITTCSASVAVRYAE